MGEGDRVSSYFIAAFASFSNTAIGHHRSRDLKIKVYRLVLVLLYICKGMQCMIKGYCPFKGTGWSPKLENNQRGPGRAEFYKRNRKHRVSGRLK